MDYMFNFVKSLPPILPWTLSSYYCNGEINILLEIRHNLYFPHHIPKQYGYLVKKTQENKINPKPPVKLTSKARRKCDYNNAGFDLKRNLPFYNIDTSGIFAFFNPPNYEPVVGVSQAIPELLHVEDLREDLNTTQDTVQSLDCSSVEALQSFDTSESSEVACPLSPFHPVIREEPSPEDISLISEPEITLPEPDFLIRHYQHYPEITLPEPDFLIRHYTHGEDYYCPSPCASEEQ